MTKFKPFLILLTISLMLSSCSEYTAKFEVNNKSEFEIDSIIILNHELDSKNTSYYSLDMNEKKKIEVDMTNVSGDGNYQIRYKLDGQWYAQRFGYYTNGSQMETLITIDIVEEDSLKIH